MAAFEAEIDAIEEAKPVAELDASQTSDKVSKVSDLIDKAHRLRA